MKGVRIKFNINDEGLISESEIINQIIEGVIDKSCCNISIDIYDIPV